jgi:TPR repeat protein
MMGHYSVPLRATLTASLMLVAIAGAAVAGPFEEGNAAFSRGDYPTALRLWRPLAEQGFAEAEYDLGYMYLKGHGVPPNYAEAMKWYRLAADQGLAAAQHGLGVFYADGKGVPQDYAEAVKWYRLAADQGFVIAQYSLGSLYADGRGVPQDYVQAHMWFYLAAAQGTFEGAVAARDNIVSKMTPAQIAEAQKLAREWKPKAQR